MERREALASFRPTSAGVPWPFDRVRDGQSDFLVDARRSLSEGKHLLAHAPTASARPPSRSWPRSTMASRPTSSSSF